MNRRKSLKLISTLPLVAAFPTIASADAKAPAAKGPANLIDENDTLANALKYKHDASKSPDRTNKKAFCNNCAKYNKCSTVDKGCKSLPPAALKKAEAAPCEIFPKKVVKGKGWCFSWAAKV